ncbi:ABC transporter ATP-binding protein [Natrarchaeobius halalkaliphilus]|uniref:Molybdate/tungstate import ATP-binding protein WtpC n=1 Tax=Natrarchaeobius halalkaliphilus TaxID=1679091 RepID=A0A3N6NVS8_9EURY|nr:ABC transporter ATP-binding protein [Natrarchaeobius halalkaliphilus]RQG87992.1 ABC transporter ATP-binding protein [Natrarchaeobius halalkaliphilus]
MASASRQSQGELDESESDVILRLDGVTKNFGSVTAVDDVSFSVRKGEFFSIVGPSGCGKTTTLRMIAGFEQPSDGRILLSSEDVSRVPPYDRDLGMVFQGYALFPHKTVGENVGFGLKMQGEDPEERQEHVADILDLVDLAGTQDRYPKELSGGQQQRVALARALVIEPSVLLLDEPLSNLDRKLREEMRFELKRIQEELGITTIYVTHDQEEAMSMSDRVLVLNGGESEQVAPPYDIYHRPRNQFVAEFIGDVNTFPGTVEAVTEDDYHVDLETEATGTVEVKRTVARNEFEVGDDVLLNVRPEDFEIVETGHGEDRFTGQVITSTFLGKRTNLLVDVGDQQLLVEASGRIEQDGSKAEDAITISWKRNQCILTDVDSDHVN